MENAESAKIWYVTHGDEKFGPVSMDEMKFEAVQGELNPRLDMVWKEGMENWVPAGEIPGLYEVNKEAAISEKADGTPVEASQEMEKSLEKKAEKDRHWGTSRAGFIFGTFILPILLLVGLYFATTFLEGKMDPVIPKIATAVVFILLPIFILFETINRLPNLGMSRWWWFGLLVPVLSLWIGYRMTACPQGYAVHKRMDTAGLFLAVMYWIMMLLFTVAVGGLAFLVSRSPGGDKILESPQQVAEQLWEKIRHK